MACSAAIVSPDSTHFSSEDDSSGIEAARQRQKERGLARWIGNDPVRNNLAVGMQ